MYYFSLHFISRLEVTETPAACVCEDHKYIDCIVQEEGREMVMELERSMI